MTTPPSERSIANLPEQAAALPAPEREMFDRVFAVTRTRGELVVPPPMRPWVERTFGAVERVEAQTVVKVLNRWTLEGSLFNDLRASRPMETRPGSGDPSAAAGKDPFCAPLTGTPADTFGRVEGRYALTASNVAKYDGLHAVVVFSEHDALSWDEARVVDRFETAMRWLGEAHRASPRAVYPFVMWNCLPRSGASIPHGHMQATLGEGSAYARVEVWRRAVERYRELHGRSYTDDLHRTHLALGLGGERWLAHLTPLKEKELVLLAPAPGPALYAEIHRILRVYVDHLGVRAFNLAMYLPPLAAVEEDWGGFPVVVRLVDRGDPASATSDIGAMELFAQPVVASDPWRLAERVRQEYALNT